MLCNIFSQSKRWLVFVYGLILIEFTASACIPFLLGKALDSIIKNEYQDFINYILTSFGFLLIGIVRRRIDSRIFMKIWKNLSLDVVKDSFERNTIPSKISVKMRNIFKFTDFCEYMVPSIVRSVIQITVAIATLFTILKLYSFIIIVIMLVSLFVCVKITKIITPLIEREQHVNVKKEENLVEKNFIKVTENFNENVTLTTKRNDWEAYSWGFVDLCCIFSQIVAIFVLAKNASSAGQITSSLIYVDSLCNNFMLFPMVFRSFKELKVTSEFIDKN